MKAEEGQRKTTNGLGQEIDEITLNFFVKYCAAAILNSVRGKRSDFISKYTGSIFDKGMLSFR
jgi:hypothetical protein